MLEDADPLAESIIELVRTAASVLAETQGAFASYQGLEEWYADGTDPTVFRRRSPVTITLTMTGRSAIESTEAWRDGHEALLADATLGPRVDNLVGSALGATRVEASGLLHAVVEEAVQAADPAAAVGLAVTRWRQEIGGDHVVIATIVIVDGVAASEPVHLSDDVVVRQMTNDEVALALRSGAMATSTTGGPLTWVHQRSCLALERVLPRVVGDLDEREMELFIAFYADLDQGTAASLATLRLLGYSKVRARARITLLGGGSLSYWVGANGPMVASPDPLDSSTEPAARALFTAVAGALAGRPRLAIALRRFNGSHEPRHEEDTLLDLWIAMEALYGPDDPTEATFRLAQNAANCIEVPGVPRRSLFEWVRKAYDLRSKIAHGRDPDLKKQPRLRGGPVRSLGEAADDLREVVRLSLLHFLDGSDRPDFTALSLLPDKVHLGPPLGGSAAIRQGRELDTDG